MPVTDKDEMRASGADTLSRTLPNASKLHLFTYIFSLLP